MSKAVLLSIKPKYCDLIASGKKTIEVRKTKPIIEIPFKCYIYCTKAKKRFTHGGIVETLDDLFRMPNKGLKYGYSGELMCSEEAYCEDNFLNGKVIGEFICDDIKWSGGRHLIVREDIEKSLEGSCLTVEEIGKYLGLHKGMRVTNEQFYGWHISELKIYDKPKDLCEFKKPCKYGERDISCFLCDRSGYAPDMHIDCFNTITRPPQSWCYVEEIWED